MRSLQPVKHLCSTVEGAQYCEGYSVLWRDTISTVGNTIFTIEGYRPREPLNSKDEDVQYCGEFQ